MKPDCFCYDKVIGANTDATAAGDDGAIERMQQVYDLMEERHRLGEVKPNERLYTTYIRALTKARVQNLAQKASAVLEKLSQSEATVFTYTAVLMACSEELYTPNLNRAGALKIAVRVFNELRKSKKDGLDHVSFGNMLRCANLLPDGEQKDALVRSTFNMCCKHGFVNSFVVRDIQAAASEDLWRSLLGCPGDNDFDIERIPHEWERQYVARNNNKKNKKRSFSSY